MEEKEKQDNKNQKYYPLFIGLMLIIIICVKFFFSLNLSKGVSIFMDSDPFLYLLKAREIVAGNFEQMKTHSLGWSVILAPFFALFKGTNNFEYMPLQISISLIFSLLTVPLFFLVSKIFLKDTIALLASAIYGLSPHLIENSLLGLTEPSFIFICLLSFLLINHRTKTSLSLSFLLAGVALWIRANGLAIFVALLIIALFIFKMKKREVILASLCFILLFLPYVIQRYIQFGSVFDYGSVSKYFNYDYRTVWTENFPRLSWQEFFASRDLKSIYNFFIISGVAKFLRHLKLLLSPLVIFLMPWGTWLAYKRKSLPLKGLAFFLIVNFLLVSVMYPAQGNVRHIYFLYPFLIILALISLDEITFIKQSKFLLPILLFMGVFFSSFINAQSYFFHKPLSQSNTLDTLQEGQYLATHLKGKIAGDPGYIQALVPNIQYLKNTDNAILSNGELTFSGIYGENLKKFLAVAKKYNFNLIYVMEKNSFTFLDDVYKNEEQYKDQLAKVYDSRQFNLKTVKSKVFEIH